jgi:hypothetical protein
MSDYYEEIADKIRQLRIDWKKEKDPKKKKIIEGRARLLRYAMDSQPPYQKRIRV